MSPNVIGFPSRTRWPRGIVKLHIAGLPEAHRLLRLVLRYTLLFEREKKQKSNAYVAGVLRLRNATVMSDWCYVHPRAHDQIVPVRTVPSDPRYWEFRNELFGKSCSPRTR